MRPNRIESLTPTTPAAARAREIITGQNTSIRREARSAAIPAIGGAAAGSFGNLPGLLAGEGIALALLAHAGVRKLRQLALTSGTASPENAHLDTIAYRLETRRRRAVNKSVNQANSRDARAYNAGLRAAESAAASGIADKRTRRRVSREAGDKYRQSHPRPVRREVLPIKPTYKPQEIKI